MEAAFCTASPKVITHRRGTMEAADVLYGVTMQEQGVSHMLTINLREAEKNFSLT